MSAELGLVDSCCLVVLSYEFSLRRNSTLHYTIHEFVEKLFGMATLWYKLIKSDVSDSNVLIGIFLSTNNDVGDHWYNHRNFEMPIQYVMKLLIKPICHQLLEMSPVT